MAVVGNFWRGIGSLALQMAPEGYSHQGWRLLWDDLRLRSFRGRRAFGMKVDFSVVLSDFRRIWSGGGLWTDNELWTSQWKAFSCMDTCHHLDEG